MATCIGASHGDRGTGVWSGWQIIARAMAGIARYVRPQQNTSLLGMTEHQLIDIGLDPATAVRHAEARSLNSFGGPGGRIWVLLMYRGPGA